LLVAFLDQLLVGERVSFIATRSADFLMPERKAGIELIVADKQATSRSPIPGAPHDCLALRGVTYAKEAANVRRRVEMNENITPFEYAFLID
jgi:hypothetical protein